MMENDVQDIRLLLLDNGWYESVFLNTGVVAMNPFYERFTLGIAGKWLDAGNLDSGMRLWIYPVCDTLEEILKWARGDEVYAVVL